jgi:hypothetical protein
VRHGRKEFQIVAIKAENVSVPDVVSKVVDCDGVWWSRGIAEELFAVVYGREPRSTWIHKENPPGVRVSDVLRYGDLATEAGTAVGLDYRITPCSGNALRHNDLSWKLEYRKPSGERCRVTGGGEVEPIDLGIQPGDRIAFMRLHRRWGNDIRRPRSLWMRSAVITISPDNVLDTYFDALDLNPSFTPTQVTVENRGLDIWGRRLGDAFFDGPDVTREYTDLWWALLRKDVNAHQLTETLFERIRLRDSRQEAKETDDNKPTAPARRKKAKSKTKR